MIIAIIIQILFNICNSYFDAYRILQHKTIAHGINFTAYAIVIAVQLIYLKLWWPVAVIFCLQAFFNRQLSFDIPLNLRRGLPWYYQSTANPPKAIMDRIENFFVGTDGRTIAKIYAASCITTIITLIIMHLNHL